MGKTTDRRLRIALFLIPLLAALLPAAQASARTYGFLVGVSAYPHLKPELQLQGPDNDVELAAATLQRLGVAAADIAVLKSSGEQRPTRDNIINGIKTLTGRLEAGDIVYLHFAGHGSQQPVRDGDGSEGDGLDEIFLPEDVDKWQDEIGAVDKAISDNELDELITNIRRTGAFVWAVFDSCHSGTMLRSVSRIKWRNVDPGALGIPRRADPSPPAGGAGRHFGRPSPVETGAGAGSAGQLGGFVAFYAAQTHELAPELALPPGSEQPKAHGLFSYALAEAVASAPNATYRQLGQIILQKYVKQGMRATTPLFEGTALDARVLGLVNEPAPVQWPVTLRGSRDKKLYVPAGELNQIGRNALFALMNDAADEDNKAIGYARAGLVEPFGAELEPVAHDGKAPVDLAELPRSAYARLISPAFSFGLKVALPRAGDAVTEREKRLYAVIERMAAAASAGSAAEGLNVEWVAGEADADVHLVLTPAASDDATRDCARDRLWFTDRTGALLCTGMRANVAFEIGEPSAEFDANVRTALLDTLNRIGKVRNLEQMVGRFSDGAFGREVEVRLMVRRAGDSEERELDQSVRQPLRAGDTIRLDIANNARAQVDLTVLFVDSRYGINALFPSQGRTNRIEPGEHISNIGGQITDDTLGLEGAIVIASKAGDGAPVADFSFLQQQQLQQKRVVRAINGVQPAPDATSPATTLLDDLITRAGFGDEARARTRSVGAGSGSGGARTPFRTVTLKSLRWIVGDN